MKRKNLTRNALFSSIIALLLCVSMLVGTTFAWFTDSVESGMNNIVAGNLDIELEYSKDASSWKSVSSATDLFSGALWEPGHTEVVYLRLSNKGTLALKYQLGINVVSETAGTNVNGESFKLSDYIQFGVVEEQATKFADRVAAVDAVRESKKLNEGYAQAASMAAGKEDLYLALVVYMPETVGNEANYKTGTAAPTINLGINVVATQVEAELDSFGDDYDKDANYPNHTIVDGNANESTTLEDGAAKVEIPAGAEGGNYELVTTEVTTTEENGETTATMDITLMKDGVKVAADDDIEYTVTVNIGAGLNLKKVIHDGVEITAYNYDITTGDISFKTTHFSPFSFVYDNGTDVATIEELNAALNADTSVINLTADIEATDVIMIAKDVLINGNDNKITTSANRVIRITTSNVQAVLNNVNLVSNATMVYPKDVRGISLDSQLTNVELILNNCSVAFTDSSTCDWTYAVNVSGDAEETGHKITVNGGSYEGANVINVHGTKNEVIVKNATLTSKYPANGSFAACIWVKQSKVSSVVATGNTYNGENAIVYNIGYTELTESNNTDNTGICILDHEGNWHGYHSLEEAIEKSTSTIYLVKDIVLDADKTITIGAGKTVTLDLDNHTISGISDQTGANRNLFDVNGGVLTVMNGKVEVGHIGTNMGWSNSTNVFNVTAGGVLNIEDATIENLGGSDMAFAVHLNNWGEVTLKAKNTTFKSNYVAIRVFNSGYDLNNVTLDGCSVQGSSNAFWVHNYTAADFSNDEAKAAAQKELLNFTFTDTTFVGNPEKAGPIRLGMTDSLYVTNVTTLP